MRMKCFLKQSCQLLLLTVSLNAFATIEFLPNRQEQTPFIIETTPQGSPTKYRMEGYRYAQPNGRPLILAHGFFNQGKSLDEWARYFYNQGYDVFVFDHLGFGQSRVIEGLYENGDYGFLSLLNGMGLVIDNISAYKRQKVIYACYSMGGMTFNQYIHRYGQKKIQAAVLLAAPVNSLKGLPRNMILMSHAIANTLRWGAYPIRHFLNFGFSNKEGQKINPPALAYKLLKGFIPKLALEGIFKDIITFDQERYDSEIIRLLAEGFSNMHIDIVYSFSRMVVDGEDIPPLKLSFPYLAVLAEKDKLATLGPALNWHARTNALSPLHHSVLVKGGDGHLNVLFPSFVESVGPDVIKFLETPKIYIQEKGPLSTIGDMDMTSKENLIAAYEIQTDLLNRNPLRPNKRLRNTLCQQLFNTPLY